MTYKNPLPIILLIGLCLLFLAAPLIFAQPPVDQATRETDRNIRQKIEEKLITPPKKPPVIKETPIKEEPTGPKFFVKKIELHGVESFKPEEFAKVLQKYENREVAISEIKDVLTKALEREYLKKGVIAACFVPPQEVKDGVVIIRVVEAKMGELEVKHHRYYNNDRISYYWTTKPGEVLHYDKISRNLQFMNKNPDREVRATLHAGTKPGTTDVILDPKTYFPLHLTASLDREGAISTGRIRKGLGLVENNLVGLDDTFMGGYTGGKNFGGAYAYHKVPISNFGTTALYGYSLTRAFPKKDLAQFEMTSAAESYSAFLYQDLYEKEDYKGELSFGVDAKNKRVVTGAGGTLNADRLRILRLGLSLLDRGNNNVSYLKGEFSQGVNAFGARRRSVYSSRNGTNTFSKVMVSGNFKQGLAKNFQAALKFNSQLASEKLMPQEQFYMGGIDSIRGYPSGDYLGDNGFYANAELLVPAFFIPAWVKVPYGEHPIKDDITGVFFFDYGYGEKRGQIQGEVNERVMAGAGAGLRIRLLDQATLRLEWGFSFNRFADRPLTEGCRNRLHLAFEFQDRLPREVDRLKELFKEDYLKDEAWGILNDEMRNPSSRFRERIYTYLYLARKAESEGSFKDAKIYYEKLYNMGRNAYTQAEVYMRETYAHVEELRKLDAAAWKYYDKGEFKKAKEIWQKLKEDAKIRPLVLEV